MTASPTEKFRAQVRSSLIVKIHSEQMHGAAEIPKRGLPLAKLDSAFLMSVTNVLSGAGRLPSTRHSPDNLQGDV